jgi:hypothetical protein
VGGKGGGGGSGEKWTNPCMHIWIIKEKKKSALFFQGPDDNVVSILLKKKTQNLVIKTSYDT